MPIATTTPDLHRLTGFCRLLLPHASMLIPSVSARARSIGAEGGRSDLLVDELSELIATAPSLHGQQLVPVVLIGRGPGADLALRVSIRCPSHLAACILLQPTQPPPVMSGDLTGLTVLLACAAGSGRNRDIDDQLRDFLVTAGADVISQRVGARTSAHALDRVICHVFLESIC